MHSIKLRNLLIIVLVLQFVGPGIAGLEAKSDRGYLRIMNGPVLGAVGPDHALIWVRGSYTFPVQVEYGKDMDLASSTVTEPLALTKENDYCGTVRLSGLEPGTRYYYRILVEGSPDRYGRGLSPMSFKTAPGPDFAGKFRVAFGSCARYQLDSLQEVWGVVPDYNPDLFFWLGDNIYGDSLDPDIIAEEYRRQREIPDLKKLMQSVPQLAIWDDHDFGLNDHDRTNPVKAEMLEVFKQYWANPSYGTEDTPGVFFHYTYGGVDFIFLDNRYYRDPNDAPDSPEKTHLGAAQFAWLKDQLLASEAPFKVLICGGGWSTAKGADGDAWSAFIHERNRLFDFIRDEEITGVVLMSGDTHVAELNAIPWSEKGGYDLYDLVSSPLAQEPGSNWIYRVPEVRMRRPYNQLPNFGLIEFDLTGDPKLTFNIVSMDGRMVWEPFVLHATELQNGVQSWETKQDGAARRWMNR